MGNLLLNIFWPRMRTALDKPDYRSKKLTGEHRQILRMLNEGKSIDRMPECLISDLRWSDYIDREYNHYSLTEKAYKIRGIKKK